MSDEAVVRVILTDSTFGANRGATQSSTANVFAPTQQSINPDRLFRELTNLPNLITRGFRDSLYPVVKTLNDILDVLGKDYDYSEKDFRETSEQTSLLKVIGAALSGQQGATTREITKGLGLQSSELQTIGVLRDISANIRDLKLSLAPEAESRRYGLLSYAIVGTLAGLGIAKGPELYSKASSVIGDTLDQIPNLITKSGVAAGQVATQAADLPMRAGVELGTRMPETMSWIADNPETILAALGGAAIATITYALLPEKEREKSTNELLQEIIDTLETQNVGTDELIRNQTIVGYESTATTNTFLEEILTNLRIIAENSITLDAQSEYANLSQQPQSDIGLSYPEATPVPIAGVASSADAFPTLSNIPSHAIPVSNPPGSPFDTTGSATLNPSDIGADLRAGHQSSMNINPPALNENIPVAIPHADLYTAEEEEEDILAEMRRDLANAALEEWKNWQPTHWTPHQWLTNQQLEELAQAEPPIQTEEVPNTGGRLRLSAAGLEQFLQWRERQNLGPPEYFARGGVVGNHPGGPRGSDTVPAWLTPGETVIPAYGATGGIVSAYGGMLAAGIGSTDPGYRIGKLGDSISALGSAVPVVGAFVQGLGEGVKAVGMLVTAINETVDKYGEYSPEIAQAQAMVEIRQTMADMRRANEIGTQMAKFVVAQGEVQQKYEEIKIKLLMEIVPAINSLLNAMNDIGNSGQGIEFAIKVLTAPLDMLASAVNAIRGVQEDARLPDIEDPATILLRQNGFDTSVAGGGSYVPIR